MSYFPVALDLRGRRCLVVGGGTIAERKIESLLAGGAEDVVVVALEITGGIREAASGRTVRIVQRTFQAEDLDGAFLVLVATDDPRVNADVAAAARARRVLVNAADDPANCDFIMPAVVRRGDLQVAISTSGESPAFARFMRELIEELVPAEYGQLLDITAEVRSAVRQEGRSIDPEAWQGALRGSSLRLLRTHDTEAARRALRAGLGLDEDPGAGGRSATRVGRILLVGAGPGDPGLLTVAGREALAEADLVLYDRLANEELLALTRPEARKVYVGKGPGNGGPMSQDEINAFICAEALNGHTVVRLKGGDPFVFGRGGEEALAAVAAGVPFAVVPGVTAAVGVPAYAGIPLTHRGLSSAFTVVTGQQGAGAPELDWSAIVRLGGTLVLLMGVEALPSVVDRLVEAGLAAATPAAIVEWGTMPSQRVVTGSVHDIVERARAEAISAPATTVIGQVVALADQLCWYEPEQLTDPAAG